MSARTLAAAPVDPFDEEDRKLQERARAESGPVKTTLDLDSFIVFKTDFPGGHCGRWCSIDKQGCIRISSAVGREITTDGIELRINKVGTILAIRAVSREGLKIHHPNGHGSKAILAKCKAAARHLEECGISLPARYELEWDDELKVWVGRLWK